MKRRFLLLLICALIFLAIAIAFAHLVPANDLENFRGLSCKLPRRATF